MKEHKVVHLKDNMNVLLADGWHVIPSTFGVFADPCVRGLREVAVLEREIYSDNECLKSLLDDFLAATDDGEGRYNGEAVDAVRARCAEMFGPRKPVSSGT